ncbi:MAG TPA: beta-ketoacyl-ACP synthase III [Actinophytocola sp.]|nr:beta-ketoacyl-ACP synthase III [Actinophytocola sp.]
MNAVVCGLGACLPPTVVTNEMLAAELDTSDEWIRGRTGVGARRVVEPGVRTSDLATEAGRLALESAERTEVELVVVATSTPDRSCPAVAPLVATRLGLAGVAAFDVAAVCSGFVYAMVTAAGLVASSVARSALVVGADTFSTILDPADRATRAIFGDGAGAVVLRAGDADEPGVPLGVDLGSDGQGYDLVTVREDGYLHLSGPRVYFEAVRRMTASATAAAARAGWRAEDVDAVVPHQANVRILDDCAKYLGIPPARVVRHIEPVGNTVAGSIPLALAWAAGRGELKPGDRTVLTGFGGGLTWGSIALRWPDLRPRYQD